MGTLRNLSKLPAMPDDEEVALLLKEFATRPLAARPVLANMLGVKPKVLGEWMQGTSFPGDEHKRWLAFLLREF